VRVNASGTGWIVARLPFDRTAEARDRRRRRAQGKTKPASIPLQLNCGSGFGTDRESAIEKLKHSQHWHGTLAVVLDQPWRLAPSAASLGALAALAILSTALANMGSCQACPADHRSFGSLDWPKSSLWPA